MRARYFILLLILIFTFQHVYADEWYEGSLVLKSQETLRGKISIRHDLDVIFYRTGTSLTVYPAHKVQSFYIYDTVEECNRRYISLQLSFGPATYHQFYEVVLEGSVSVLRRQRTVWYSMHLDVIDFDYFIQNDDRLTSVNKFRRKVYPNLLQASSGELSSFARSNKLNMHRLADIIKIIDHFNSAFTDLSKIQAGKKTTYKLSAAR